MKQLYSSISRSNKKLLFVAVDLIMLPLALWSSFALRYGDLWPAPQIIPFWWMFVVVPLLGVLMFSRLGLYRAVVRFMGYEVVSAITKGVVGLSLSLYALAFLSGVDGFSRVIPINFAIISGFYISATRFLVRAYYHEYVGAQLPTGESVLIYGAGESGIQLAQSLMTAREYRVVGFIDDDRSLHNHVIHGVPVSSPGEIGALIDKYSVHNVLLAIPSASSQRRKQILEFLKPFPVHIQTLPSLNDLVTGNITFQQLQEIELDDLLGRDTVPPDEKLLKRSITGKVVMVTGAGGSIGSELCRQILKQQPKLLIMYEQSEFALYSIEKELVELASAEFEKSYEFMALLGSVLDRTRLDKVIAQFEVQTIFHAAAYKHVPMVEHNVLEGVRNNVFGTKEVAESALEHNVERFILISTDKAVRPTNVMGATKRVAEQVIQHLAVNSRSTIFSMVRFGNVLGSSGSVVPLFRRQIKEGGPITVTHREIVRYFMSIPEAAQLVIQAGAMASGGEVFVLDMGEPVKIYDLARNMIELSGMRVCDDENPDGDIEIKVTGLRPGEKLYEELLIGDNVAGTEHQKIMRADEDYLSAKLFYDELAVMDRAIADNAPDAARDSLLRVVKDYKPSSRVVDYLADKPVKPLTDRDGMIH